MSELSQLFPKRCQPLVSLVLCVCPIISVVSVSNCVSNIHFIFIKSLLLQREYNHLFENNYLFDQNTSKSMNCNFQAMTFMDQADFRSGV